MTLVRLIQRLAVAAIAVTASQTAFAQNATRCGLTGQAVAAQTIQYDPFSPSGLSQVQIPLTLTRAYGTGGRKTQTAQFILVQPSGSPAYQITATGPSGENYGNILYTTGATGGLPNTSAGSGQVSYNFGGQGQDSVAGFMLNVTVPPGTDLSAGEPIKFDIRYVCTGTGGMQSVLTPETLTQAVTINVNVLSALQASYVGSALDFGEVGDKTTAQVQAAPATYTTPGTNGIRVASSSPYKVELTSPNQYRLTFPGGSVANANQRLSYQVTFLGQTKTTASPTFAPVTCARAGTGGVVLPIRATLLEGGQGKQVSPNYTETLTVTVTPLVAASAPAGQQNCPAL